jgi:CHAT domain-containing protein
VKHKGVWVLALTTCFVFGWGASERVRADASSPVEATSNDWKNLLADADSLRSQWSAAAWRQALQKYQAVLPKLRRAGLRREEARVLRSLGLVHLALGNTAFALEKLNGSLAVLEELKPIDTELVDTVNDVANAYLLIGDNSQARDNCNRSLDLSRSLRYARGEGLALELTGQVEYASGDRTRSLEFYSAALAILKKESDEAGLAQTFLDFGYSYSDLSETDKATQSFDQALALWRSVKNPRGEALTLTALGHLLYKLGDTQRALNLYDQSIQLLEPLEDRIAMSYNLDGQGFIYSSLGDTPRALQKYTKKLELLREARYQYGEIGTLWRIGEIHIANEDYAKALEYLNKSLVLSRIGGPRMQSIPVALIGQVHERQNKPALALQAYKQALTLNREGKDPREEAYTLNDIGRVQEMLGFKEEALTNYEQALTLNRVTGDRFGESGTLYRIARLEQTSGKLKDAKLHSEQSIALIESLRAGVASHDLRSSYVATVHQQYELYIDILMSLHAVDRSVGFDRAALEASEAGRARTLLETLAETKAQIRKGVDPKLLERERALQLQLEALATRQVSSQNSRAQKTELDAEIERVTAEFRDVQGQIRARSPHYAALVQPVPLKVEQIQQMLDPGTLLLEYSLGEKRSFLWALTRDSIASYELPPQASIETIAQRLYSAFITLGSTAQPAGYESDARALSSIVFGQIANRSEAKRLVIVADGVLQYIPFAALPEPVDANAPPRNLISHYEIVGLPSASVLAVQRTQLAARTPAPKAVAVLADPVFDNLDTRVLNQRRLSHGSRSATPKPSQTVSRSLRDFGLTADGRIPRLVFSLTEADAVYSAAPQTDSLKATAFKASRATATSPELSQYRIVHIATHGWVNSKHPELSAILLSMVDETGAPVDGILQLHEIYNLKLPAELVVLSACETGIGKQIRGEGLIALTRGFMYAGAARVVASLWKVDDSATAALMARFYKEMFTNGKTPAAALKAAQNYISEQKRWRDPYYWAGFVLQGEWR